MYAIRSYYEHREIDLRIDADQLCLERAAIGQRDRDLIGPIDHMVIGDDVTVLARITSYNVCYTKLLRNSTRLRTIASLQGSGALERRDLVGGIAEQRPEHVRIVAAEGERVLRHARLRTRHHEPARLA